MTAIGRLLLVTHYFPAHRGGVESVAARLASEMGTAGWQVDWFASATDPAPNNSPNLTCHPVPAWNGSERHWGLPYPLWSPTIIPRLWRAIGKTDVVHLHDYLYSGNLLTFLFAKLRTKPIIVTQHIGTIPYDSILLSTLLEALNRSIGRVVLSRSDQVVFISPAVQAYFSRFSHFRHPPQFIANGVDEEIFKPQDTQERQVARSELGYSKEDRLLLFVGRFVEKKGLPLLRQLAQRRPDWRWIFAGQGPLDPAMWHLPNVRTFSDRSGTTLAELYNMADLLILPGKGEGFPLVIQEAMACGTPVLTTPDTAAGAPDMNTFIQVEALSNGAADAWLLRIDALLSEYQDSEAKRAAIALAARRQWSWSAAASAYQRLFVRLRKKPTC